MLRPLVSTVCAGLVAGFAPAQEDASVRKTDEPALQSVDKKAANIAIESTQSFCSITCPQLSSRYTTTLFSSESSSYWRADVPGIEDGAN